MLIWLHPDAGASRQNIFAAGVPRERRQVIVNCDTGVVARGCMAQRVAGRTPVAVMFIAGVDPCFGGW